MIVVFAFAVPAMAQETTPPDQKAEQGEKAQQKERTQRRRDGKQEGKPGDKQNDKKGDKQGKKKDMPGAEGRRRPMPPNGGDAAGALQRITQLLKRMDTDSDGAISKTEAPERLQARFDTIDTNGDEKIDKQELMAMFKKMGERAGAKPGDRRPATDKPPGKDGEPARGPNAKNQKKMRDRAPKQDEPSGGSVEPVRPGKGGG